MLDADVARSSHADRHRPDRRDVSGGGDVLGPTADLPGTFAVKLSAQDDAVRERVALGYRSEVEFYTGIADKVRIPVPAVLLLRHLRDGGDFVLLLADMAPAVQGDQIARLHAGGGRTRGAGAGGTARPELVRPGVVGLRPSSMPKPATRTRPRASATSP